MTQTAQWALFLANPAGQPPFPAKLGIVKSGESVETVLLENCQDIPDGVVRIETFCTEKSITFSPDFTLLYPIYMNVMDTDDESTMHQIAWLILDEANSRHWKFDRIGGLTGQTENDFFVLDKILPSAHSGDTLPPEIPHEGPYEN